MAKAELARLLSLERVDVENLSLFLIEAVFDRHPELTPAAVCASIDEHYRGDAQYLKDLVDARLKGRVKRWTEQLAEERKRLAARAAQLAAVVAWCGPE